MKEKKKVVKTAAKKKAEKKVGADDTVSEKSEENQKDSDYNPISVEKTPGKNSQVQDGKEKKKEV